MLVRVDSQRDSHSWEDPQAGARSSILHHDGNVSIPFTIQLQRDTHSYTHTRLTTDRAIRIPSKPFGQVVSIKSNIIGIGI